MNATREAVRPVPDAAPPPRRGVREPVRLALALFSAVALPGPEPDRADRRMLRRAVLLAPAVGLVLGLAGAGVVKLGRVAWTEGSVMFLAALGGLIVIAALSAGRTFAGLAATADDLATPGRRPTETQRGAPAPEPGPAGEAGEAGVGRAGGLSGAAAWRPSCSPSPPRRRPCKHASRSTEGRSRSSSPPSRGGWRWCSCAPAGSGLFRLTRWLPGSRDWSRRGWPG